MINNIKTWLNGLYQELTTVNESPHRVALSFSLGVFLGILPFTGVLAAIGLAWYLKLNKAAAILGSAITNTWLGFIVLGIAVKIGAKLTGLNWHDVQTKLEGLFKHFTWDKIHETNIVSLIGAVAVGYVVVSLIFALLGYILARIMIAWHRSVA